MSNTDCRYTSTPNMVYKQYGIHDIPVIWIWESISQVKLPLKNLTCWRGSCWLWIKISNSKPDLLKYILELYIDNVVCTHDKRRNNLIRKLIVARQYPKTQRLMNKCKLYSTCLYKIPVLIRFLKYLSGKS